MTLYNCLSWCSAFYTTRVDLWPKMSKHRDISRNRHPNWTNQNLSLDLIYGFPLSLGPWAIKTRQWPCSLTTWEKVCVELSQYAWWWLMEEVGRDRDRERAIERDRERQRELCWDSCIQQSLISTLNLQIMWVNQLSLRLTLLWLQVLSFETEKHLD